MKAYIKIEKTIIKFEDIEIEEQKFHQYKRSIPIKKIDINNIVVSNKTSFGKKVLNVSLAIKMLKKLDVYAYFFQKWVHVEKTLRKLYVFLDNRWWTIKK